MPFSNSMKVYIMKQNRECFLSQAKPLVLLYIAIAFTTAPSSNKPLKSNTSSLLSQNTQSQENTKSSKENSDEISSESEENVNIERKHLGMITKRMIFEGNFAYYTDYVYMYAYDIIKRKTSKAIPFLHFFIYILPASNRRFYFKSFDENNFILGFLFGKTKDNSAINHVICDEMEEINKEFYIIIENFHKTNHTSFKNKRGMYIIGDESCSNEIIGFLKSVIPEKKITDIDENANRIKGACEKIIEFIQETSKEAEINRQRSSASSCTIS